MNYKMIVLDIDDTLLNSKCFILPSTKKALEDAQKNGVIVTLCSGRPGIGMKKIADELELKKYGGYIVSYNGANIIELQDDTIIYENNLNVEQIHRLYDISKKYGLGIHTYSKTNILAEQEYKFTKYESDLVDMKIQVIDDFKETVKTPVVKAIMVEEPSKLREVEESIKKETKDMTSTFSKPFFFEFTNNAVDKGKAIKYLCEKIDIKQSEVIAFGDSHNDLPMLKYAGKGVAMGNAVNEVKEMADFVTKTNDDDGISFALEKFLI